LLVGAAEPQPVSQRHDIVGVNRNLRVLLFFRHESVGSTGPHRADERQNTQAGQQHLNLPRQPTTLGHCRDASPSIHRAVAVQIALEERRDLLVRAPEEEVRNSLGG
jgi:hypothetical protein